MSPVPVQVDVVGLNVKDRRSVSAVIGGFTVLRMPPWTTIVPAASARCAWAADQVFWSGRWAAGWVGGGAGPEVLVRPRAGRLVGRDGVEAGRLVPQPRLVGTRPVAPEEDPR